MKFKGNPFFWGFKEERSIETLAKRMKATYNTPREVKEQKDTLYNPFGQTFGHSPNPAFITGATALDPLPYIIPTNTVVVDVTDFFATDTTNPNKSYTLVGSGETISMSQSKSFIGKSVKLENVNLSSEGSVKSTLNIVANDSKLNDLTLSGSWSKDISGNTMITLNNTKNLEITNLEIDRTNGYNAVEIGLDGKGTVKNVVIDGLKINSSLSNNGINIFSFEDGANITIKNCHFKEVSNPIRISNMTYAKNVNITIKDCTFDKWESNTPAYAGLILLQDHISTSTEEFNEKNPFATFNITIDNVTGPYGKITKGDTMENMCGSSIADKQLIYLYGDHCGEGNTASLIPYSKEVYPILVLT